MPGSQLTHDEAIERARLIRGFEPAHPDAPTLATRVLLDLRGAADDDQPTFRSTTTLHFGCREPGAATFVDLVADGVQRATLNGEPLPATAFADDRLWLDDLQADNELVVEADCLYMHTGEGLHRFRDPVDAQVYLYTQFETADARRVYACFDQPDLKTTFELDVLAASDWQVVSTTAPDIAAEPIADDALGAVHWHFPASAPVSTYVTAVIAGPYHVVRSQHECRAGVIPLGLYCRRTLADHLDADDIFTVTAQGFDFYEKLFGRPYAFDKYDQLFVPEFNAGAMENVGAVTFLEDYLFRSRVTDAAFEQRASTILHELAHMWFGDLVTMRWWDDLWLNESFATYMSTLALAEATRWGNAWTTFANEDKTWAARQDQLPTTHPIAAEIVDVDAVETNFDGITYAKGAAVLKQLVAWVGRDAFFTGLRSYFDAHAWGNTTLQDLLSELERASRRDLSAWSKQWLESAGVTTLRPDIETDADQVVTAFAVVQEVPPEHPTLRSHRLAIGWYDRTEHALTPIHRIELDVVGARTEVPELVGRRRPDVVLVNDEDLTYAKIRLDEASLAVVTDAIGEFSDPLARALCWSAAWDMTRDAEMAARDYLRLVIHLLDSETEVGVLQTLLRQARLAVERWADPAFRSSGLDALATAAYERMHEAAPGSDHQLAFVRAFAANAHSDRYLDVVASLLEGTTTLPGLPLDTDLRWSLLLRLAGHGRVGDAEIDAELGQDDTAAGRRHAATVRAALPTAQAKQTAWTLAVERSDVHNAEQSAVIAGFQQAGQEALLAPYARRYLEALDGIWATRTGDTARSITEGMFPYLLIDQSTIDLVDEYLRANDLAPGVRRLLVEGRDGLARALRARARDRAAG